MSRTLQFKRYANTVVANTTGAAGEIIIETTNNIVTVHTGSIAGGVRMASESYLANSTNIVLTHANAAFNVANVTSANITFIYGVNATQNTSINTASNTAQYGFDKANSANVLAQTAYNQGNIAFSHANVAFNQANTGSNNATLAFNQGNIAFGHANAAFNSANVIVTINTSQNNSINLVSNTTQAAFNTANTGSNTATLAYTQANTASNNATLAFAAANSAAQTVPQNAQTTNYTLVGSDAGKHLYYTQSANVNLYIPWSSNASFANGTTIMIVSRTTSSANVTVTPNTGVTMYLAGNTTSASRNVTTYGMATLIQVAANTWMINGTGVV